MSPFDPRELNGTPHLAPLVPALPIRLRRTEILTVVYRTDTAAAERVVPEPLRLTGDLVILHVYWMHDADWFGVYGESAWQIPVELPGGGGGVYSPFLILGSDGAVAAGREQYGQPKKIGEVSLRAHGDLLVGRVSRNGIEIATATTVYKQQPTRDDPLEKLVPGSATNVNLRVTPEAPDRFRRELITREFVDVVVSESWIGPATLELRANAQAPVYLLPVREVVLGLHRTLDLTLAPGRVIHRY